MEAPLPSNEVARLHALLQYEILDTSPEQVFDYLTRLAAHICTSCKFFGDNPVNYGRAARTGE